MAQARRHIGHKRRRSVGGTPGRRRLASEDHQTSEDQKTTTLLSFEDKKTTTQLSFEDEKTTTQLSFEHQKTTTQLSHVWHTRASLIPRSHSLIGQRERSMPIFGAKPERNACTHIWGKARAQRLCPYLGRSQSATLVPIFGAKQECNSCAHIWGEARA